MIVKLSIVGLFIILVAVILLGYHINKDGFQNLVLPETTKVKNSTSSDVEVSEKEYEDILLKQKADILKEFQNVLREEILLDSIATSKNKDTCEEDTICTAQGKEYENSTAACPINKNGCLANKNSSCPGIPDMQDYIKKDEIPCWGCSIDY